MNDFKQLLKKLGISYKDFSEKIGIGYASFLTLTSGKSPMPRWVQTFLMGYELGKKSKKETNKN